MENDSFRVQIKAIKCTRKRYEKVNFKINLIMNLENLFQLKTIFIVGFVIHRRSFINNAFSISIIVIFTILNKEYLISYNIYYVNFKILK